MNSIAQHITSGKILVSDGAWGTFLHQKGLQPGECPELWNLTHQSEVLDIAKSYVNAGADMILTNSFGGSPLKLKHYDLSNQAYEINKAAAEISKKAAGADIYVLGSMGPTGKILMMGDVSAEELYEGFKIQATALEQGGANAACIETMADLDETQIAIKAVRENTKLEIVCTFTFEKTVSGDYRTMMGISPAEMVPAIIAAGADVIGANCGNGTEGMINIVREMRAIDNKIPILVHANAGTPIFKDGKTVFPESPADMVKWLPKLIEAGANIIGGCCGTGPEHIRAIAKYLK
jgi:5-methyltetrahydrofolate--homocysteine methyltransferase